MRTILRILPGIVLIVLGLLYTPLGLGQVQLSPIIQELRGSSTKPAKGEFTVTNAGIQPLNVTLEIQSLTFTSARPIFGPLTPGIDVRLSETSFRIPPKASHEVYFEIRCVDCGVAIASRAVVGRTLDGIQVALSIPETIYLCQKVKGCRDRLLATNSVAKAAAKPTTP